MKKEILSKLKNAESMIGKLIVMMENNEPAESVIALINQAVRLLSRIEDMILKNHLINVSAQVGLSKKLALKYYKLMR